MNISSRLDYALSCVIRVADSYQRKNAVTVSEIAQKEKIEVDYVEQLLIVMRRSGIVKSIRGPRGGYVLARPPAKITLLDIVAAIEKKVLSLVCDRTKGRRTRCIHLVDCRAKELWQGLGRAMESYLEKHTLKDMLLLRRKEKGWVRGDVK